VESAVGMYSPMAGTTPTMPATITMPSAIPPAAIVDGAIVLASRTTEAITSSWSSSSTHMPTKAVASGGSKSMTV